jgi:ribose-phosphate pyrophosphokinase
VPMLAQYVKDNLKPDPSDLVIVSPNAGRVKMARKFARKVGVEYALLEKEPPASAQEGPDVGYVIGAEKIQGKTAVIVDDIIDTGGTLAAGAQTVVDSGAAEVFAVATHGLFSGDAYEALAASPLAGILVSDTVPLRPGAPDIVQQLTCTDILADSVRRIFTNDSVSEIFAGENQLF